MTGFEPQISRIGGDRSTNWATTAAQSLLVLWYEDSYVYFYFFLMIWLY